MSKTSDFRHRFKEKVPKRKVMYKVYILFSRREADELSLTKYLEKAENFQIFSDKLNQVVFNKPVHKTG